MGCRWTHTLSNRKSTVNQPICTCPNRPHVSADRPGQQQSGLFLMSYLDMRPSHHTRHNPNYPVGRSAYNDGRSAYNHGRSGYVSGQSVHESFEEDYYMNPRPSQQHFPSHYTMHQPINSRSRAQKSFPAPPRRPETNDQTYDPYRANENAPRNSNQWGERQHANIQPTPPMFDQRARSKHGPWGAIISETL
jgi:hypothetical protein